MAARRNATRQGRRDIDWDFFTFPVYFGVAGGALLALVLIFIVPWFYLFMVALFAFTFGLSHLFWTGRRQNSERRKQEREEEAEVERRILQQRAHADEAGTSSRRARRRRQS